MHEFFKNLSDQTRLRCLLLIFEQQELCVCELMYALDLPQSKISRHLSILRLNGLLSQRREGQWMLYSMAADLDAFAQAVLELSLTEVQQQSPFKEDRERLAQMTARDGNNSRGSCCV